MANSVQIQSGIPITTKRTIPPTAAHKLIESERISSISPFCSQNDISPFRFALTSIFNFPFTWEVNKAFGLVLGGYPEGLDVVEAVIAYLVIAGVEGD